MDRIDDYYFYGEPNWDQLPSHTEIQQFFEHVSLQSGMEIDYELRGMGIQFQLDLVSEDLHIQRIISWAELENDADWRTVIERHIGYAGRSLLVDNFETNYKTRKLHRV